MLRELAMDRAMTRMTFDSLEISNVILIARSHVYSSAERVESGQKSFHMTVDILFNDGIFDRSANSFIHSVVPPAHGL
jgi:hypothetical protein